VSASVLGQPIFGTTYAMFGTTHVVGRRYVPNFNEFSSCIKILEPSIQKQLTSSGTIGLVASAIAILWSAYSASSMFVIVLEMKEQRLLVAYPVALLYSAFAIVTVF
jgi:hypothetical protein